MWGLDPRGGCPSSPVLVWYIRASVCLWACVVSHAASMCFRRHTPRPRVRSCGSGDSMRIVKPFARAADKLSDRMILLSLGCRLYVRTLRASTASSARLGSASITEAIPFSQEFVTRRPCGGKQRSLCCLCVLLLFIICDTLHRFGERLRVILHQFPGHAAIYDRCCIQHTQSPHAWNQNCGHRQQHLARQFRRRRHAHLLIQIRSRRVSYRTP